MRTVRWAAAACCLPDHVAFVAGGYGEEAAARTEGARTQSIAETVLDRLRVLTVEACGVRLMCLARRDDQGENGWPRTLQGRRPCHSQIVRAGERAIPLFRAGLGEPLGSMSRPRLFPGLKEACSCR